MTRRPNKETFRETFAKHECYMTLFPSLAGPVKIGSLLAMIGQVEVYTPSAFLFF